MSGISSYILSIAGIIVVSLIVELVMSEGELSKFVKSIFSFFTIAVIIAPLPNLLSKEGVSSVFDISNYELQEGYIVTLNKSRLETMATEEEVFLTNEGYKGIQITLISLNMEEPEMKISKVEVDLKELSFLENAEHKEEKSLIEYLNSRYTKKFDIEKGEIVYEGEVAENS